MSVWRIRIFSLESYKSVFMDKSIMNAFMVSIARTVVGTITSVLFTAMVGYAFSKKHIFGNKFYLIFGTITMFFSGLQETATMNIVSMGIIR